MTKQEIVKISINQNSLMMAKKTGYCNTVYAKIVKIRLPKGVCGSILHDITSLLLYTVFYINSLLSERTLCNS